MSRRTPRPALAGLATVLAAVLSGTALVAPAPAAAASGTRLLLTLDNDETLRPGTRVRDTSGYRHHGRVRTLNDGRLRPVTGWAGTLGGGYPRPCWVAPCPKAMVRVADEPELNPRRRSFSWGVRLRLPATRTSPGSNLLQKGLWGQPGGQWKLQVDGWAGRPSCVVSGFRDGAHRRVSVLSSVSVADGAWHQVTCWRSQSAVSIVVDGVVRGSRRMAPVRLDNDAPVTVGAKNADKHDNDQFHGRLDQVVVRFH